MLRNSVLWGIVLALATPVFGHADVTITFVDLSDTIPVQYTVNEFGPFDCNFTIPGYPPPAPERCTLPTGGVAGIFPAVADFFNIYEPDGVTLSDTLSVTSSADGSTVTASFQSDADGVLLLPFAGGTSIIENGGIQTADIIAMSGSASGNTYTVRFQSDVPEPASVALLISVLVVIAILRIRSRVAPEL